MIRRYSLLFLHSILPKTTAHVIQASHVRVVQALPANVVQAVKDGSSDLKGVIRNPIGSISKVPGKIKSEIGTIKNYVGQTSRELKKLSKLPR